MTDKEKNRDNSRQTPAERVYFSFAKLYYNTNVYVYTSSENDAVVVVVKLLFLRSCNYANLSTVH